MAKFDTYNSTTPIAGITKAYSHITADLKYLLSPVKYNIIKPEGLDIAQFLLSPVIHRPWHLTWCLKKTDAKLNHILEFGVGDGYSMRVFAGALGGKEIFGFDSFEGLPEDWVKGEDTTFKKGTFKQSTLPEFPPNVKLIKGFFSDSVPKWLKEKHGDIKLMHVDCDLYSSAKEALSLANERIKKGTIIIFDELFFWRFPERYKNWREGEWRALSEWMREFKREIIILCRDDWEAAAVVVAN